MDKFEVTVSWVEHYCGTVIIKANSLEEAKETAELMKGDIRNMITSDNNLGGYQDRDEPEVIDVSPKEV